MATPEGQIRVSDTPVELVLFDLGGVLADFRGAEVLQTLTGAATEEDVWLRWLESPWMRRFDAGLCSGLEFATGAIDEWQLPYAPAEFLAAFRAWLIGPFDGAEALVRRTASRCAVGCLSNMNAIHWDGAIADWELTRHFNPRFVSYQLGMLKPDGEIFEHVRGAIGIDPGRVLFLDDNPLNIESAVAHGFRAVQARGVEEAERALRTYGVLN